MEDYKSKAKVLDKNDSLSHYRQQFHMPKNSKGEEKYYFCGHSLGLQPKLTEHYIKEELSEWAERGVEGHFT